MKKAVKKKVVKKVEKVEKEKTLEELEREIKWLHTEWRADYSSARFYVRRDRIRTPGRVYKIIKVPDKGFGILTYGREKKDYENISLGKEWAV